MTDPIQPTSSMPVPATGSPPAGDAGGAAGGAEKAKAVAGTAASGAGDVAHEARDRAVDVAHEATAQAQDALQQVRQDVRRQADEQADRGGEALRQLGSQLHALRTGDIDGAGPVAGYAQQLQQKVEGVAERIESGGVDGLLDDVRSVARRRPGAFLFGAAVAGFAVGRLVRSSASAASGSSSPGPAERGTAPTIPPASPDLLTNPLAGPTQPVTVPPVRPAPAVQPTTLADARPPIGPA